MNAAIPLADVAMPAAEAVANTVVVEPGALPEPGSQVACEFESGEDFGKIQYLLYVPSPSQCDDDNSSKGGGGRSKQTLPLLLFLHGAGETNKLKVLVSDPSTRRRSMVPDGPWRLRTIPGMLPAFVDQRPSHELFPFILVAPQCPKRVRFSNERLQSSLRRLIERDLASCLPVDLSRIYITGLSMGGYGTWSFASRHADFFAAAAPICGGLPPAVDPRVLLSVPLWVFHGANDAVIPVSQSDEAMRILLKCHGELEGSKSENATKENVDNSQVTGSRRLRYTRYKHSPAPIGYDQMVGHASWAQAYFEDGKELFNWMLTFSK